MNYKEKEKQLLNNIINDKLGEYFTKAIKKYIRFVSNGYMKKDKRGRKSKKK